MREATKPIMLFTAIAFVALMVFEWGMDITGQSSGGLGEMGRVNSDAVMYDEYMAAYNKRRKKDEKFQTLQTDVDALKSDISDMKSLLLQLVEKNNAS